jgi:RimJ/RimL family protein N-acetyltransferase
MSNIEVHSSDNFLYLRTLLDDPEIYHAVRCDDSPALKDLPDLEILKVPDYRLLMVTNDHVSVGAFYLFPIKPQVWEIHTMLSKNCRGRDALRAGQLGIDYMFMVDGAECLMSRCPSDNPASLLYAQMLHFHIIRSPHDWRRNGQYIVSHHVELTRKEWDLCLS